MYFPQSLYLLESNDSPSKRSGKGIGFFHNVLADGRNEKKIKKSKKRKNKNRPKYT